MKSGSFRRWLVIPLLVAASPGALWKAETALPREAAAATDARSAALRAAFRYVETFDDLQDWSGNGAAPSSADDPVSYERRLLPKRLDGSFSFWGYWANKGPTCIARVTAGSFLAGETVTSESGASLVFEKRWELEGKSYLQFASKPARGRFRPGELLSGESSGAAAVMTGWPPIIASHGEYSLGGRGKSLMMNLGDNDNEAGAMKGIGAQRLGFFFGDGVSGKSGLKKAHLFMMLRFKPNFFPETSPGRYAWLGIVKMWDMCPGFTAINFFGTPAEHASVSRNPQNLVEYGAAGGSLVTLTGGGASLGSRIFFDNHPSNTVAKDGYWQYRNGDNQRMSSGDNDIQHFYSKGEWFAVEYALDMGSLGRRDGTVDFWVYDRNGKERGHFSATGLENSTHFDHWINKIVLGGNRRTRSQLTSGTDGRFFIDDVIVDPGRIGPRYFQITRRFDSGATGGEPAGGDYGTAAQR
ncbi:MAG TPA: hypothetical protein VJ550_10860 [Geomonas sp.]|nr:hypothetical protein [Geomonas sp.]